MNYLLQKRCPPMPDNPTQLTLYTIGSLALLAPYVITILLLTIPWFQRYLKILSLAQTTTLSKVKRLTRPAAGQIHNRHDSMVTINMDATSTEAAAAATEVDVAVDAQEEESEEHEQLGAVTKRLGSRWWVPLLTAIIVCTIPVAVLQLGYYAPWANPSVPSDNWHWWWIWATTRYALWMLAVFLVAAARPKLAHPLDAFDLIILLLVAVAAEVEQYESSILPDRQVQLWSSDISNIWWPNLSSLRITMVNMLLVVFLRLRDTVRRQVHHIYFACVGGCECRQKMARGQMWTEWGHDHVSMQSDCVTRVCIFVVGVYVCERGKREVIQVDLNVSLFLQWNDWSRMLIGCVLMWSLIYPVASVTGLIAWTVRISRG
jgi:hypothetical protein